MCKNRRPGCWVATDALGGNGRPAGLGNMCDGASGEWCIRKRTMVMGMELPALVVRGCCQVHELLLAVGS
jgi:hypothetical protein